MNTPSSVKRQIGFIEIHLPLGNRFPPIFKRHNAFQWTLMLPVMLTLGVAIPLHSMKKDERNCLELQIAVINEKYLDNRAIIS